MAFSFAGVLKPNWLRVNFGGPPVKAAGEKSLKYVLSYPIRVWN
jgi:hypothetical protein